MQSTIKNWHGIPYLKMTLLFWYSLHLPSLFQALAAGSKSVDPALFVHSLHSYFLRTGDNDGMWIVGFIYFAEWSLTSWIFL